MVVFCVPIKALVEKEVSVSLRQERINNRVFKHQKELSSGVLKELWIIDGVVVNASEYREAILDAERDEARIKREAQESLQRTHDAWFLKSQQDVYIKVLREAIKAVQYELDMVTKDVRLHSFYFFDKSNIGSSQELEIIKDAIGEAYRYASQEDLTKNFEDYRHIIKKLEGYPSRLRKFYHASVTNAIANSNDTKFLQELLDFDI